MTPDAPPDIDRSDVLDNDLLSLWLDAGRLPRERVRDLIQELQNYRSSETFAKEDAKDKEDDGGLNPPPSRADIDRLGERIAARDKRISGLEAELTERGKTITRLEAELAEAQAPPF